MSSRIKHQYTFILTLIHVCWLVSLILNAFYWWCMFVSILENVAPEFDTTFPQIITLVWGENSTYTLNLSSHSYDNNTGDQLRYALETSLPDDVYTFGL